MDPDDGGQRGLGDGGSAPRVGRALLPQHEPRTRASAARDREFARGVDVVYVDVRLDQPATELVGDDLSAAGFGFAGVFPSALHPGEILRYQALRDGVDVTATDVSVASDHGRELLDYVLEELA